MADTIIDYSAAVNLQVYLRGTRTAILKLIPEGNEVIDETLVKVNIGINGAKLKTLTLNNGIVNNNDGTFSVSIKGSDFKNQKNAQFEIYGYQNFPDQEIAIGSITYYKALQ
jgi:hypothetical protein